MLCGHRVNRCGDRVIRGHFEVKYFERGGDAAGFQVGGGLVAGVDVATGQDEVCGGIAAGGDADDAVSQALVCAGDEDDFWGSHLGRVVFEEVIV